MKPFAILLLLMAACRGEADPPAGPVALQHHEVLASQLPAPFASASSGNPPSVSRAPSSWTPSVPPGFHAAVFAKDLEDPRNLLLASNGDVLVVESSAGDVKILRGNQRFTLIRGLRYPYGIALRGDMLY